MSERRRNPENVGLPTRWRRLKNAYYYKVPEGQESSWDGKKLFRLGKTMSEAYRNWIARTGTVRNCTKVGELLEEYAMLVIPEKAPASHGVQLAYMKRLKRVFGEMLLDDVRPKDIYAFSKSCLMEGKTRGRGEIEVLSHAFSKAVEWGYIDRHPFLGQVRIPAPPPRDRYIEDWEVEEMFTIKCKRKKGSVAMVQAYLRLKMMTGMSRGDLLRLTDANLTERGILIQRHKTMKRTGKRTLYCWTPELHAAVDAVVAVRPCYSRMLFCNTKAMPYVNEETGRSEGFSSIWDRFVTRVLKETKVKRRFTDHDFRAKAASDAQSAEHARALLSHADINTTNRVYRRKPEEVMPLHTVV